MAPSTETPLTWIARIEEMESEIVSTAIPIENGILNIIKEMLLAPEDDTQAVDRAVQDIHAYYSTKLFPPDDDWYRNLPDHGVSNVIGTVVDYVFDLAEVVSWRETGHQRLANLVIGLMKTATADFNPENPQLGWSSENLEWHAAEIWRTFTPPHKAPLSECTTALNTHALLARLVAADMFPTDGPWRTAKCISEGLQPADPSQSLSTDSALVRACRAAIAVRYILLAGDVLVKELRERPGEDTEVRVGRGEWGVWEGQLRWVAGGGLDAGGEREEGVGEWDLKGGAEEAGRKVRGWLDGAV